jgi:hypothetical protein
LSFFDEADDPEPTASTEPRPSRRTPRRGPGRSGGSSRRPPGGQHQQDVQTRRLIAVGVIVVIVIAMALLIHGCQVSQTNNSLKNYNASVSTLISASDSNGSKMFRALGSGELNTNLTKLQNDLTSYSSTAGTQLSHAQSLSAPGQMANAQSALVQVMQLRSQAMSKIAGEIQAAANKDTSKDAVDNIAVATSMLYGSDVNYKTFVTPDIAKALNGAGIPIGTAEGEQQINPGQIVTNLSWLDSSFISTTIGAQISTSQANSANNAGSGPHGHELNYVSVNGTELSTTSTNTLPASSTPTTFTLNLTNSGDYKEYYVGCKVTVNGLSDTGTATIPVTTPGQATTCSVKLASALPAGTYQVTAEVDPVAHETNTTNNSQTYSIVVN